MPTVLARGREGGGECSEQQKTGQRRGSCWLPSLCQRRKELYIKKGERGGGKLRKKGAQREKWETGARVVSVAS